MLEGGTTFRWVYMQQFLSVWCPSREGVKDGRRQKKNAIWALLLSLLALILTFQQNYHNNQLLVKPNEMVGLFSP